MLHTVVLVRAILSMTVLFAYLTRAELFMFALD